jgi:hypothetical protein
MQLTEIYWTPYVNLLTLKCECGMTFQAWSRFSIATCPACKKAELWHDVDPKPEKGPWGLPVVQNRVFRE